MALGLVGADFQVLAPPELRDRVRDWGRRFSRSAERPLLRDSYHAYHDPVRDTRNCEQCGALFDRRREHARFCSCACRIAWNRDHEGDLRAAANALDWSVAAMCDATERLTGVTSEERSSAFVVISEAVWWVTIVDATLVRYHEDTYESVMAAQPVTRRRLIEGTFGGLRFVRNQMGYYLDYPDFIEPGPSHNDARDRITAWSWRSMPEPVVAWLPPRGQAWEIARYRAYESYLAGRTIGQTFRRASAFLKLASSGAAATQAVS